MKLIIGKGFFHVGNEIIDRWIWTGLNAVALQVFLTLLRHAYGEGSEVWPSRSVIAQKCGVSVRYVGEILNAMHDLGMLAITINPGRPSTVDLRPAEKYFSHLKPPCGNPPEVMHTQERAFLPTQERAFLGQTDENRHKGKENRIVMLRRAEPNNTRTINTSCRNKATAVERSRNQTADSAPKSNFLKAVERPGELPLSESENPKSAEKGRGPGIPDATLLKLASCLAIPDRAKDLRGKILSDGTPGTDRQKIETLIRHELRSVLKVPTRVINRWFEEIPADGILHYMNQAYTRGRNPAAWLVAVLKQTKGEYSGRGEGAA